MSKKKSLKDESSRSASLNDIFPIELNFIKANEKLMKKLEENKNKFMKAMKETRKRKKEEEKKNIVEIEAKRKRIAEKRLKDSSNSNPEFERSLITLPLNCSKCQYTMVSLKNIQRHLSESSDCRSSQFKCIWCPKSFIWPTAYIIHFRKQHLGPGGKFKRAKIREWHLCEVCRKPLLSKHSLNLHRKKFHGQIANSIKSTTPGVESENSAKRGRKQGTKVCRLCKKTFLSRIDFVNHMRNFHSSNDDSNLVCESDSRNSTPVKESNSFQSNKPFSSNVRRKRLSQQN